MQDRFDLSKRRALVTGGGSGIGRAIALALADAGARVAVTDRDPIAARAVAAEIGAAAIAAEVDVTQAAIIAAGFDAVEQAFGGVDIVCANAGVSRMKHFTDVTEADWAFTMDVNAKGVFLTDQEAVRRFLAAGTRGVIVNTASLAGKVGDAVLVDYTASKFAVVGLTQAVAKSVAKQGIRVNCVCPGFVRTSMQEREVVWEAELRGTTPEAVRQGYVAMTPLGRIEEPEDVADVVVFLASDAARFMTGQAVNVTGGVYMG
jgi:meso-butanediol dehydrogenase / (S,S)-butanediol dehydrogenase / diacetyl reductase